MASFPPVYKATQVDKLLATKAPLGGKPVLPGSNGRNVLFPGAPNALVYGVNLGIGPNTTDTMLTWTTSWDPAYQRRKLDRIARLGCNSVRIQGLHSAYAANPTQYVARVKDTIDYAMSVGLRVLFCFLNSIDDASRSNLASGLRAAYAVYFKAFTDIYSGNPMILGWDIGNELRTGSSNDIKLLVQNAVTDLRALDPGTPITSSICGTNSGLLLADITATEACGVDFQDVHIYNIPYGDGFHFNWIDDYLAATAKPIIFSEFGSNLDPVNLGGPHLPSETMQAALMRTMRRYAHSGQVMGFMPWVIEDDSSQNLFGLYSAAGAPRKQLAEFTRFPATANAAAADAVAYRTSPVVIADFQQPDSATGIPNQPLGGAPAVTVGTWGVTNRRGVMVTPDAGGQNIAVWETNTADPDLHLEIELPNSTTQDVGLILRATDATHWIDVGLHNAAGIPGNTTAPGIKVESNNGGVITLLGSVVLPTRTTFGAKLRVICRYDKLFIHFMDEFVLALNGVTFNRDATKHGLYLYKPTTGGDGGSKFRRFTAQVPIQLY